MANPEIYIQWQVQGLLGIQLQEKEIFFLKDIKEDDNWIAWRSWAGISQNSF